jgi:adenylate cyclase
MTETKKKKNSLDFLKSPLFLLISIVISVLLGLLIRYFYPSNGDNNNIFYLLNYLLKAFGKLYLNLLQLTIFPIVMAAIITSLAGLMKSKHLSGFILKFLVVFACFYVFFGVLGTVSGVILKPGEGLSQASHEVLGKTIQQDSDEIEISLSEPLKIPQKKNFFYFFLSIIPDNIFRSLVNDSKLQVVFFSILFGIVVGLLKGKLSEYLMNTFSSIMDAFQIIINWILYLLPFGIICLLASQISEVGLDILLAMTKFVLSFFVIALAIVVINTAVIWKRSRENLSHVMKIMLDPIIISLVTRNSFAALPASINAMDEGLNFNQRTTKLLMPLGTTIGRFGNILYFSLAAVFVAQLYGIDLKPEFYSMIIIGSIFAGIATAGSTGPATISVMSFVLSPLGLPIQAVLIVFMAIDAIIDPVRTLLIVHTNMAATSLIAEKTVKDEEIVLEGKNKPLITFRASIVLLLSVLLVVTGVVTSFLAYNGGKKNAYFLSKNMLKEITGKISDKTVNYMRPAERTINQLKYLIESGRVDYHDTGSFVSFLKDTLMNNGELGAIYLATPNGNFAMTKRMQDGSFSYRVIRRNDRQVSIKWIHENESYRKYFSDSTSSTGEGYDPRKRGWYQSAVDKKGLIWEDVYVFASDNIPGVTCAIPMYEEKSGSLMGVLGIDIGVMEFSFFLGDEAMSKIGKAVLLNNKDEIIAVGMNGKDKSEVIDRILVKGQSIDELKLILAEDSGDELIKKSYYAYQGVKGKDDLPLFEVKGSKYLAYYQRFFPNDYFHWSIGIVIPEKTIMGTVDINNVIVLSISFFFIILSLFIGINFSGYISRSLRKLSGEMEKIQKFELDDVKGVNSMLKEVHEMNFSFMNMVVGLRSFKKYVPSNLVSKLMKLGHEAKVGGEKRRLTLFFSDIRDFTRMSEKLSPEILVENLVEYLSKFSGIISENNGTVDKYMGDGIMAFWGAPDYVRNHPVLACYAALDCQAVIDRIAREAPESHLAKFYTRIGLHTGEVIVGNMGSNERLNYTVIGDAANLASRLEGLNKYYGTRIIISDSTFSESKDHIVARLLDKVAVKGKSEGVFIYELVAKKDELSPERAEYVIMANKAAELYFEMEWEKAADEFDRILSLDSSDIPAKLLRDRCAKYMISSPGDDWNGVFMFDKKF